MPQLLKSFFLWLTTAAILTNAGDVRKPGAYTFDAAGSSIATITAKDGKPSIALNFRAQTQNSTASSHMSFDETGILREGWFIYIESTKRLWIFDGKNALAFADRSDDQHTKFVANIKSDPKAAALCLANVKNALPPGVRTELFNKPHN